MLRAIIYKCKKLGKVVDLSKNDQPTKIPPWALQRLIQEVANKIKINIIQFNKNVICP